MILGKIVADPTTFILTEGETDDVFFARLIDVRHIGSNFTIFHRPKDEPTGVGAFSRRLVALKTETKRQKIKSIIIVGDNDGNPAAAFHSIKQQVESVGGYNAPANPREISETGGLPAVSILMLPWDNEPGCLETLCLRAVNQKYEKEMRCATMQSECVGVGDWPIQKQSKMILRCLLSSVCKSEPNTPLTRAWSIDSGRPGDIFPLTNPAFDSIAEFLRGIAA